MTLEFEGIPSGDMECFCFDVDLETYIRMNGYEPHEYAHGLNEGTFRYYPHFEHPDYVRGNKVKVTITVEPYEQKSV